MYFDNSPVLKKFKQDDSKFRVPTYGLSLISLIRKNQSTVFLVLFALLLVPGASLVFASSTVTIVESPGQTEPPLSIKDDNGDIVFKIFHDGTSSILNRFINLSDSGLTELRNFIFPDSSGTLVLENSTQTLSNKTIDADANTISNIDDDEIKSNAEISWSKISKSGSSLSDIENVTPTACSTDQILKFSVDTWICADDETADPGSGEANTASNTIPDSATQKGLSKAKSGTNLPFKVISSGINTGISTDNDQVKLDALNQITTVSANTTLDSTYGTVLVDASGGAKTITLPTAVGIAGKIYSIKKTDSAENTVTIATTSSQTIDGATTLLLRIQHETVVLQSNGANWEILAKYEKMPFAQISDSTNQAVAASGAASNILLNQNNVLEGIIHSTSSNTHQITIVEPGTYQITGGAQVGRTTSLITGTHNLWLQKNGANVPDSNIKTYMPATIADTSVGAFNYVQRLNAGDIISFQQSCPETTNIVLHATAETGSVPATPSIVVTVLKISD